MADPYFNQTLQGLMGGNPNPERLSVPKHEWWQSSTPEPGLQQPLLDPTIGYGPRLIPALGRPGAAYNVATVFDNATAEALGSVLAELTGHPALGALVAMHGPNILARSGTLARDAKQASELTKETETLGTLGAAYREWMKRRFQEQNKKWFDPTNTDKTVDEDRRHFTQAQNQAADYLGDRYQRYEEKLNEYQRRPGMRGKSFRVGVVEGDE